jgi:hypothetical protein
MATSARQPKPTRKGPVPDAARFVPHLRHHTVGRDLNLLVAVLPPGQILGHLQLLPQVEILPVQQMEPQLAKQLSPRSPRLMPPEQPILLTTVCCSLLQA